MATFSEPRNPVEVLAEEFLDRRRRGAGPAPPINEGWRAKHGDFAPMGA
jgi:hypothetical protein